MFGKKVVGKEWQIHEGLCKRILSSSSEGTCEQITETGQQQEEVDLERKSVPLGNVKYCTLERTGKNILSQQLPSPTQSPYVGEVFVHSHQNQAVTIFVPENFIVMNICRNILCTEPDLQLNALQIIKPKC